MASETHQNWKGLLTNASAHSVGPGYTVSQDNICCLAPGRLDVRAGLQPIAFSGVTPSGSASVISVAKYDRPEARWILYERTDGALKAIRSGSTSSIRTSLNVAQPLNMVRDRRGFMYGVNGVDRGFFWDGAFATTQLLGVDAPAAAPTVATPGGGGASAGDYVCYYRFLDKYDVPSNLSPVANVTAASTDQFDYTALSASTQTRVNRYQIFRSTVGSTDPVYLVATFGHNGTITSSANNGGTVRHTVPAGHNLIVGAIITVSGSSVSGYNTSQTVTAVTATTVDTGLAYPGSAGTGGTWQATGLTGADLASDDTLSDDSNTILPIVLANGSPNANRFTPPPTDRPFMAMFQDRMFYFGRVRYTAGTVSITAGATSVTGSSTAWTQQMVGRYLYVAGETTGYLITAVGSATGLTIATPYVGVAGNASGASYAISPAPSRAHCIDWSEQDEPESVPAVNTKPYQENTGDHDEETGLMPFNGYLYLLHERHIYPLSFIQQPAADMSIDDPYPRGCVNDRAWTVAEGKAFLCDQDGPWSIGDAAFGIEIQDAWRESTVDLANAATWWTEFEPNERVVRFYVGLAADSTTRPKRAFCYCLVTGAWWVETYRWELGHGCRIQSSGKTRLVVGGENDYLYYVNQGTTDGVTAAIRGSVTSATGTTLTDSGASFTSAAVGSPVAIIAGTGKGQIRTITAQTSTQLTVATWTTTPDTTSVYLVGAIPWNFRTGTRRTEDSDEVKRIAAIVSYLTTTNAAEMDVRKYLNNNSTPEVFGQTYSTGEGISYAKDSADATLNLKASQYSLANAPGQNTVPLYDANPMGTNADRWLSIECRGWQGADRIKLFSLELEGVTGDA